ncbi:hypothetical protein KC19_10G177800 [Ceratodon purpureus]|uniref:Uncharacterized protein n=1 Tax=Ceratodon purpureus TaxID=3225 RepID=A0A8T0GTW3_CERPU|nr:hypothetical protein KC19_10G177800 [Ceratodon purpureus]
MSAVASQLLQYYLTKQRYIKTLLLKPPLTALQQLIPERSRKAGEVKPKAISTHNFLPISLKTNNTTLSNNPTPFPTKRATETLNTPHKVSVFGKTYLLCHRATSHNHTTQTEILTLKPTPWSSSTRARSRNAQTPKL